MVEGFEKYLFQQDRSLETVKAYVGDIRIFGNWFESVNQEEFSPDLLTNADVKQYKYYLLKKESSPNTINRKLMSLRNYCKWAISVDLIDTDPTLEIKPIKQQEVSPKWLTKREQFAILRTLDRNLNSSKTKLQQQNAIRAKAAITVLLHTGLRVQELSDLRFSDILLSERKGSVSVRHGKGLKARIVPLNETARNSLKQWLEVRPKDETDAIFTGKGHGLNKRAIQEIIEGISQDSKCPFSSRQLRSSFAKNLLEANVSIEKISSLLGHNSLNTTRLYILPSEQDKERAVDSLVD